MAASHADTHRPAPRPPSSPVALRQVELGTWRDGVHANGRATALALRHGSTASDEDDGMPRDGIRFGLHMGSSDASDDGDMLARGAAGQLSFGSHAAAAAGTRTPAADRRARPMRYSSVGATSFALRDAAAKLQSGGVTAAGSLDTRGESGSCGSAGSSIGHAFPMPGSPLPPVNVSSLRSASTTPAGAQQQEASFLGEGVDVRRGLIATAAVWLVVLVVWFSALGPSKAAQVLEDNVTSPLVMLLGAFVAGSTPIGGGAVAFPLMTLVQGRAPQEARDFSLAIQAIGMNAAGLVAIVAGVKIDWTTVVWSILGGCTGMLLAVVVPASVPRDWLSVLFSALWCGFAFCLGITNRLGSAATHKTVRDVLGVGTSQAHLAVTLFCFGVLGGIVSLLTGLGIDTVMFAVMVLRYRVKEHVAQPTSVLLMGIMSLVGLLCNVAQVGELSGMTEQTVDRWLAAVPVVAFMAPLGILTATHFTARVMVVLVCAASLLQFAVTLFVFADVAELLVFGSAVLLLSAIFFHVLTLTGPYGNTIGAWLVTTDEAAHLSRVLRSAAQPQQRFTLMFEDVRAESLFVKEHSTSRYQPVFVLVALCTTSISLGAFLFQHMWDTKPETVVASVVASGVLLVAFALQVVRRFVAHREAIAATALTTTGLQVLMAVGVVPDSFTHAGLVLLSLLPFIAGSLLQVRFFTSCCIHATMLVLAVAVAGSNVHEDDVTLFLSSLVLAYALSAVMNYNSETAARGNFTLRLALSSQVALAEQEAVKVKSMMKATAEAEATKRSEKWLTHILAGVASPMVIISQSGSVRDANKPAEQLFGWSRSQLRLRNVLSLIAPDDQALLRPVLDAMRQRSRREKRRRRAQPRVDAASFAGDAPDMLQGTRSDASVGRADDTGSSTTAQSRPTSTDVGEYSTEEVQLNVTQADGSTVTVDLAIGLAGSVFVVTFHDVTEKVALLQQAQEAVAAKRNFLAFICHELRNPLNGICGMGELLLATELDEEQEEYASFSHANARSMLHIVNDVLDFSKVESNKAELEIIPFNVRRIAKSLRKQYGILLAKLGGVEMRTHVGEGVAKVLLGDPARINQILLNFLSNAVKFTQEGSITLDIDVSEEDDRQQTLSFSVRDTGVGIREEDQAKLFQSYSQATSHTSRQFGGTGLGLAICKALATAMGGSVTLDSAPNVGSTFAFHVPLLRAGSGGAEAEAEADAVELPATDLFEDTIIAGRQRVARTLAKTGARPRGPNARRHGEQAGTGSVSPPAVLSLADGPVTFTVRPGASSPVIEADVSAGARGRPRTVVANANANANANATATVAADTVAGAGVGVGAGCADSAVVGAAGSEPTPARRRRGRRRPKAAAPAADVDTSSWPVALIVDDSLVNQRLLQRWVQKSGLEVAVMLGEDGVEAVDLWRANADRVKVVLMDVNMPRMNGLDATTAIREAEAALAEADGRPRHVEVVGISANVTREDEASFRAAGMDRCLGKPMKREGFVEAVKRACQASQQA